MCTAVSNTAGTESGDGMSVLRAGGSEARFAIRRWLGVNENPDGDTNLQPGEAAVMRNFRITDGGALKKRPGSAVVAGLMNGYTVHVGDAVTALSETGKSSKTITMYPFAAADSVGTPGVSGDPVDVTEENAESCIGYYSDLAGQTVQFAGLEYTAARMDPEDVRTGFAGANAVEENLYMLVFDAPPVFHDGEWDLTGGYVAKVWGGGSGAAVDLAGKYVIADRGSTPAVFAYSPPAKEEFTGFNFDGQYLKGVGFDQDRESFVGTSRVNGYFWRFYYTFEGYRQPVYTWNFRSVYSAPNEAGTVVKSLWSGYVGGGEYIVAACNHYLWSLSERNGIWSKREIGPINTDAKVCLFGFGGKLYCLDGTDYYCWDETHFGPVEGYVPLIAAASPPEGGGTPLERVNLLTAKRRQRFSPDGTAKTFHLAEDALASVDAVTVNGTKVSGYTADLSAGTVTFEQAPEAATDSLEITYTAGKSFRSRVTAMTFSELYNGVNDSRVFLYGDGSNVTIYSDLEENGQPSAEYFPDLNEIAVGDENTPLTALIRMYNRLMAYKAGSAWSIYYDSITLEDGTVTAGFYCNGVNRSLGNDAMGQICLVENRPRTLDGRSIYEWKSSGGAITNDQRNAQCISRKVEATLAKFDPAQTLVFYDKIGHEYYCVYNGTAVVQNVENQAWYIYTDFPASAMIVYRDELYFGGEDGYLRRLSDEYTSDDGAEIDACWESGSMSFDRDHAEKYSPSVWVGLKQENGAAVTVGIETDRQETVAADIALSAGEDAMPRMNRARLKAKKFTYYKLIFRSCSADTRCTVVAADVRVRFNINVK